MAAPPLAEELAVEIVANGTRVAVLMCTPLDLDELALGHLFTRGMIGGTSELLGLSVCPDRSRVKVETAVPLRPDVFGLGQVVASGCGSGLALAEDFLARPPIQALWNVGMEWLRDRAREMFAAAELYRATGGVHCAAVARVPGALSRQGPGEWFAAREDVGRHNAVDKAIGRALLDGVDLGSCCLLCSGRVAADMALKAAAAGIPLVASRSIPTTAAFEIARRAGICLVGRVGSSSPFVYTLPGRVYGEARTRGL